MKIASIGFVSYLHSNLLAGFLTVLCITSLHAEEVSVDTLKAQIAGLYTLEEWHKDGEVFRPPQVDGRLIILNGLFTTILQNRMQPSSRSTTVLIGRYELNSDRFSYGYDDVSVFTEEGDATKVSHKPMWDGMRAFIPGIEGDLVRLRQVNGPYEFVFTSEGLNYFDDGKLLRKWRRTTDK